MSNSPKYISNGDVGKSKKLKLAIRKLDREMKRSVGISERNIGLIHTGRQRRALFIFSKLILHNLSMMNIVDDFLQCEIGTGLLDHFSVGALGRTSIDAALMTMYIAAEGLTSDSWNLRRHILYLHDLYNRRRFLKSLGKAAQTEDREFLDSYQTVKDDLLQKIDHFANELGYEAEKIDAFKAGQNVFVEGMRGAAREAGWDVQYFDFNQSYLSAHVHSHPVSFMRADEHGIKFDGASDFQIGFAELVVDTVRTYTKSTNNRMDAFSDVESGDPLGHIE